MSTFKKYVHKEESVYSAKLDATTQTEIVNNLMGEAAAGLLQRLVIDYDTELKHYTFAYRYMGETTDHTLTNGQYLVKLNAGNFTTYSAEDFEDTYIDLSSDAEIENSKSVKEAMLAKLQAAAPEAGFETEEDINAVMLGKSMASLESWYDSTADTFSFKFNDSAIVDPEGLADVIKAFPEATYMTDNTKYVLDFDNGEVESATPNQFNYIALMGILAEIRKLGTKLAQRFVGITFRFMKDGAPSAVAPSVTDEQWNEFVSGVESLTGITNYNAITR